MKKYTLAELNSMETIHQGHTDDLKIETVDTRVWLSRLTVEDGMKYNNQVTVEKLDLKDFGGWKTVKTYPAIRIVKTFSEWKGTIEEYLGIGDEIDQDLYYHFLEVVPPQYVDGGVFQCGEAYDAVGKHNRYLTFNEIDGRYFYLGIMTTGAAARYV